LVHLAVAWVIRNPAVTSAIIGPRTMEQLVDNLGALEVTVTDADRETIDALVPPGSMVSPFYNADFGPHQYR
jgi:aryl-alcohol dehydrogenase-like predicted oxidoreductase